MEKKFSNKLIIEAIIEKYGSVENFSEIIGTSHQNIYNKIGRQSAKFFKLLKDNGVVINSGGQIGSMKADNNKGTINISANEIETKNKIEKLENEIEMLKELIRAKDKVITLLENK